MLNLKSFINCNSLSSFMSNPKVLIGCPTSYHSEYALKHYKKGIDKIDYNNYEVLIVENSDPKVDNNAYVEKIKQIGLPVIKAKTTKDVRDTIVFSRNLLRAKVLENDFDYFLSLEQDVIPPPNVIKKFLEDIDKNNNKYGKNNDSNNIKVISGVVFYYNWNVDNTKLVPSPQLWDFDQEDRNSEYMYYISPKDLNTPQVKEIKASGLSCVFIHRDVLEKVRFRVDHKEKGFDDMFFSMDLRNAGFKLYVDTEVRCDHLRKKDVPHDFVEYFGKMTR